MNPKSGYLESKLADLEVELANLEKDFKDLSTALRGESNPRTKNYLERQINSLGLEMKQKEDAIKECRHAISQRAAEDSREQLIAILDRYCLDQSEYMLEAYQETIRHWPGNANIQVKTGRSIVTELCKIAPGKSAYSARVEFVAHLVATTTDAGLADELTTLWGATYAPEVSWLDLHDQIEQREQARRQESANQRPAIFLSFDVDEEASTQSSEDIQLLYRLRAWLIGDVEIYKSGGGGCDPLIKIGSSENAARTIEEILSKMTPLLNQFLEVKTRRYPDCEYFPEVHVFLPRELMHLAVDRWPLDEPDVAQPERLGHEQPVMLRCHDRYRASYRKRPKWLKYWRRSQTVSHQKANTAFISGNDKDLQALFELLEETVSPTDSNIVGLQLTHSPVNFEGMCQKVLDAGVPLAIWPRTNLAGEAHCEQLSDLLAKDCLSAFPRAVQHRRSQSRLRRNPADCYIGHHLSLWWDDPDLVPPKSA